MSETKVRPVPLRDAVNITLDNFYDLLKAEVGTFASEEFLQLKVSADPVDISPDYEFFSEYNLLIRSERAIDPTPVSGDMIVTPAGQLDRTYRRFIQKLRGFVVQKELSIADQNALAELELRVSRLQSKVGDLEETEKAAWIRHAKSAGVSESNAFEFFQWRSTWGETQTIDTLRRELQTYRVQQNNIMDRKFENPEDREIIDAEFLLESVGMRLRYPTHPDYEYGKDADGNNTLSLSVMGNLPTGSTALFDDKLAVTWSMTTKTMKETSAGQFEAKMSRETSESNSISTDWSHQGSAGWGFISVNTNVESHTAITEDFSVATEVILRADSAFRVQIVYPSWFQPELFTHRRVRENIGEFEEFFGPKGTLLYYPTNLVLIRGFSAEFNSTQDWSYDYERTFKATVGGGFSIFGIGFGSSSSYGQHNKDHSIDKAGTSLKFSDDSGTLRFIGYGVKKTTIWDEEAARTNPSFRSIPRIGHSPVSLPGPRATAFKFKK